MVLENDSTEGAAAVAFLYRGFMPHRNLHLLEVRYYEGSAFLLVSARSGAQQYIPGPPLFSPDGQRFISLSMDLVANYNPNKIQVWRVAPEQPRLEWELDLDQELTSPAWGPSNAEWADHSTVEFLKNELTPELEYRPTRMRLHLGADGWSLQQSAPVP